MIKNLRIRELLSPAEIREIKEIYRFAHLCAAKFVKFVIIVV